MLCAMPFWPSQAFVGLEQAELQLVAFPHSRRHECPAIACHVCQQCNSHRRFLPDQHPRCLLSVHGPPAVKSLFPRATEVVVLGSPFFWGPLAPLVCRILKACSAFQSHLLELL